jgi:pimeloyl-ACP methyl ester carboxylesterase
MQFAEPKFVELNGRKLAYDEVTPPNPKGTILLLTGLASKRLGWYKQLNYFGQFYRTIALDHRDTGDSDYVTDAYTNADQADDAAALLKALGIAKANVIGISMGGFITLQLAIRHPELVEKVVLVATSSGGETHTRPSDEMMATLVERPTNIEPGELAIASYTSIMGQGFLDNNPNERNMVAEIARYKPQKPEAYFRQLQACMSHDSTGGLANLKMPVLVVHGDYDPLVPYANGQYLAAHIPGAKFITYPQVGHIPIIEVADQFNQDVLDFLESK